VRKALLVAVPLAALVAAYAAVTWLAESLDALAALAGEGPNS
jgi:hypothetical protein